MALLTIRDDGRSDGQVIRLRADRFVIGRTEGDLLLPHDAMVSIRHAEITRQQVGCVWRWVVTDLQSTNGLYARLSRTPLIDRREFLAGGGRYRFDSPQSAADTLDQMPGDPTPTGATVGPRDAEVHPAALTELVSSGVGNRIVLTRPEYWIGRDPACGMCRPTDPFCEPRQVRVFRQGGKWFAEHPKTLNGL